MPILLDVTTPLATIDVEGLMRDIYSRMRVREGNRDTATEGSAQRGSRFLELKRREAHNHHQYGAFGREMGVKRRGLPGMFESLIKRVLRKLLGWYAQPQVDYNASVMRTLSECVKHFEALAAEIDELRAVQEESGRRLAEALEEAATLKKYLRE